MKRHKGGFSLIELIIVCAIIGLLATVAIPTFAKYKKNAAAANVEQTISDCITDFVASKIADNLSNNSYTCPIGSNSIVLSIANNQVAISSSNIITLKEITVKCTINKNRVNCYPL